MSVQAAALGSLALVNSLASGNSLARAGEALALGFSTGTWCAMYCAPILLPFLAGRERLSQGKNLSLIGTFLGGRLFSYAILGFALAASGLLVGDFFDPVLARRLSAWAYAACGAALLSGSARDGKARACDAGIRKPDLPAGGIRGWMARHAGSDAAVALMSGFSVGFHICPPYWTAAFRASQSAHPAGGALYFLFFYTGTLPFFLPFLGIPLAARHAPFMRRISRITQSLIGVYFLFFAGLYSLVFGR